MSKNQNKTIKIDVKTVENWEKTISYIMSTLDFWIKNKTFPINLCSEALYELSNQIHEIIKQNVSSSHINDK